MYGGRPTTLPIKSIFNDPKRTARAEFPPAASSHFRYWSLCVPSLHVVWSSQFSSSWTACRVFAFALWHALGFFELILVLTSFALLWAVSSKLVCSALVTAAHVISVHDVQNCTFPRFLNCTFPRLPLHSPLFRRPRNCCVQTCCKSGIGWCLCPCSLSFLFCSMHQLPWMAFGSSLVVHWRVLVTQ